MIELRKLLKISIIRFIPALGALFLSFIAARKLSVDEAGNFFFWLVVIYASSYITGLGLDTYLLREISRKEVKAAPSLKRGAFLVSFIAAIFGITVYHNGEAWILISLPMFVIVGVNSKILRAEGLYEASSLLEISSISALAALLLLLVPGGLINIEIIKGVFVLSSLIIMFVGEAAVSRVNQINNFSSSDFFSLRLSALSYSVYPLVIFVTQWFPLFLLKKFSSQDVAEYSLAIRSAAIFTFLSMSFDSYLSVKISKMHHESDHMNLSRMLNNSSKIALICSLFLLIAFVLFAKHAITILISSDYQRVYLVALPIVSLYMLSFIFGQYQGYLLMTDSEGIVNSSNLLSMVIVVVLCSILYMIDMLSSLSGACSLLVGRAIGILRMCYMGNRILDKRIQQI